MKIIKYFSKQRKIIEYFVKLVFLTIEIHVVEVRMREHVR